MLLLSFDDTSKFESQTFYNMKKKIQIIFSVSFVTDWAVQGTSNAHGKLQIKNELQNLFTGILHSTQEHFHLYVNGQRYVWEKTQQSLTKLMS